MNDSGSLNHALWECKYHIVWIPKYWRKAIYDKLRKLFQYRIRPVMSAEPLDDSLMMEQMGKALNAYLQTATHALLENHVGHNDEMNADRSNPGQ